ncbi:MAG: phage adsorption protein NrfB [Erysipelothrix sp.]|nr:phage adsorption protein NrfB [Erysipelothrix sp.]
MSRISNQYVSYLFRVYPNDPNTKEIAKKLERKYPHVHAITHILDGPSSKADNINNVINNIYKYEEKNSLRFKGIIIHDSEDIVHPYEFMLENYLFDTKAAIQIPVFPLQEMPTIKNFFKNMITGTYADEFAENHIRNLSARNSIGAFVPSAGTGFALRRDVLESFSDSNVFPVGSLTEDFKLSLQLKEKGFDLYYPLESLVRLNYQGEEKREFIATRSMFPKTYKAAVRQKTRWIYGITMQSFRMRDVISSKNLNFLSKYSLYRDYKSKISNLLVLPGYLIFAYFIFSLVFNLPIMFIKYSTSWYLMLFLTFLMIQRQILRFFAVKTVYGVKSALIATVIPPVLPLRLVVGNVINFHATVNAWKMKLFKNKKKRNKKSKSSTKPKWSKTDHEFLDKSILIRFKRTLGDDLIKKELISVADLSKALKISKQNKLRLGETIVKLGLIDEYEIIKSIAVVNRREFIDIPLGGFPHRNKEKYDLKLLDSLGVFPLFETDYVLVLCTTINSDIDKIMAAFDKTVGIVYCTNDVYNSCINGEAGNYDVERNLYILEKLIHQGLINPKQGVIGLRHTKAGQDVTSVLKDMGLLYNID